MGAIGGVISGILLVLLTFSPALVLAEDFRPVPDAPEMETTTTETTTTTIAASQTVGPLDDWSTVPEPTPETPAPTPEPTVIPEVTPTAEPISAILPGAEVVTLTKTQRGRVEKIERKVRAQAIREFEARVAGRKKDPRGVPELRVCSVNLNGYGEKGEVQRLLKAFGVQRLIATERTAINAIRDAGCDVVALQGIVGRSISYATKGMEQLVKKLQKRLDSKWSFRIADSRRQTGFQAFLVRNTEGGRIAGFRSETLNEYPLRVPGPPKRSRRDQSEKIAIVPRDYLQLTLQVRSVDLVDEPMGGRSPKPLRSVKILNGIIAKSLIPFGPEDPMLRAQIADAAIRIGTEMQRQITPSDQPINLITVDRLDSPLGAVEQILEGRLLLDDFMPGASCSFVKTVPALAKKKPVKKPKEGKEGEEESEESPEAEETPKPVKHLETGYTCAARPGRPERYFEVISRSESELKVPLSKRTLTNGYYLAQPDLQYVLRSHGDPVRTIAGTLPVQTGLPGAQLVWLELNW